MSLRILNVTSPFDAAILRRVARPLTIEEITDPPIQTLISGMQEAMRAFRGCGLAAPQVGQSVRLIVIEDLPEYMATYPRELLDKIERRPQPFTVLINPELTVTDPEPVILFEGCLSFSVSLVGAVPRAKSVRVSALNERGEIVVIEATGYLARILQHEIFHLDGVLFNTLVLPGSLMPFDDEYKRTWRLADPETIAARFLTTSSESMDPPCNPTLPSGPNNPRTP